LRLGDSKLRDLANLWSYKLIMTQWNFNNINHGVILVMSSNYIT